MKDQRWLNFASTAERMAAAYERNVANQRQSAPVSSKQRIRSVGYDNIATTQEKKAAEAEASSGGSSKRDRCLKGKSCGAACIYYRKDCILALPETVQEPLLNVRELIKEQVQKGAISDDEAGNIFQKRLGLTDDTKWGREDLTAPAQKTTMAKIAKRLKDEAAKLNEAAEEIRKESKSETEYRQKLDRLNGIIFGGMGALSREKISEITPQGLEFAQKRRAVFEEGDRIMDKSRKDFESGKLTAKDMNERLDSVSSALKPLKGQFSDSEIKYAARLLSNYETSFFETAGSLKEGGGLFRPGRSVPEVYGDLSKATAEQKQARMYMGVKTFLEQGGRDAYTGLRISILKMDWEHFIPFEAIQKFAEVENNFYLTSSRVNGGKAGRPPSYVVDTKKGLPKGMEFDSNGKLTPRSRAKWETEEARVLAAQTLKKAGFENAYYQAGINALRSVTGSAMFSTLPSDAKLAIMNKIVYGGLLSRLPGLAETAGGGIQSSGRGDKRWYFYGKENADFAKVVFKKFMDLTARDDEQGLTNLANILRSYGDQLNPMITARIPSNYEMKLKKGGTKPVVRIGGDVTDKVRDVMNELNQTALTQINAL